MLKKCVKCTNHEKILTPKISRYTVYRQVNNVSKSGQAAMFLATFQAKMLLKIMYTTSLSNVFYIALFQAEI